METAVKTQDLGRGGTHDEMGTAAPRREGHQASEPFTHPVTQANGLRPPFAPPSSLGLGSRCPSEILSGKGDTLELYQVNPKPRAMLGALSVPVGFVVLL